MLRILRRILFVSGFVLAVVAIALGALLLSPLPVHERHVLFVPAGATLQSVLEQLQSEGAVRAPWVWHLLARVGSRVITLGAHMGSYELSPTTTHAELFNNLLRGRNRLVRRLTIYEGETTTHVAGALARTLDDDSVRVLRLLRSDSLAQAWNLGDDARSVEGFLLPATYELFEREPVEHALGRLVNRFERIWEESFADRARQCRLSRYQILTLASIVEGEVVNPIEYRRVAGVYWNRLNRGMKLEADPTVQYALGFPSRRLTFDDYRVEHPYNTYRIVGLPPGPVKVATTNAIEAVLNPERHDFLFFCGSGDSSGTHRFARTYAEHLANVRRYHQVLRQREQFASARLLR
ncbi:MAG: hypothetical protein KatS3mg039_1160 [Candidatus Kapaibacterium sp.]|nr:MAG: hypothetical protein KatS3mg039_1160 [Candidatus Kapabacteria bacterium]